MLISINFQGYVCYLASASLRIEVKEALNKYLMINTETRF